MLLNFWIFSLLRALMTSSQRKLWQEGRLCILKSDFLFFAGSYRFYVTDPYSLQYLPAATLAAGVKAGELHQGHFNANQYNYLEGSVPVPGFTKPVLLIGRENMNRAVDGDVVVVEVFDEKEWKAPGDEVVDQDCELIFQ